MADCTPPLLWYRSMSIGQMYFLRSNCLFDFRWRFVLKYSSYCREVKCYAFLCCAIYVCYLHVIVLYYIVLLALWKDDHRHRLRHSHTHIYKHTFISTNASTQRHCINARVTVGQGAEAILDITFAYICIRTHMHKDNQTSTQMAILTMKQPYRETATLTHMHTYSDIHLVLRYYTCI